MLNNSFDSLCGDYAANNDMIKDFANRCPQLKSQINETVCNLRKRILSCNPLHLLQFAQEHALLNKMGITSEFQQLDIASIAIDRFAEYVQSIYVSGLPHVTVQTDNEDNEFNRVLGDYIDLFRLLHEYYLSLASDWFVEKKYETDLANNIFEAQLMYGVRGKRYQFVEKEYFSALLSPHDEVFNQLFGLSAKNIIDGIEKLQYALSQGRFGALNKLGEMFKKFQSVDEENLESCIEKQREFGQDLISKAFGIELNNIIGVTGWSEQFVKELSYEYGQETSFFSHDEYPGWPAIDLPIQKRPFIKINEQYYCFDYYSFIDNFYRVIQKAVTRLLPNYRWSDKQQNASETMVANIFKKILPGCIIYQNNYYPPNSSLKNMAENDLMVIYYDVIIVVEIKAGSFVWTAPFTDFDSHIRSYKTLVEKADNQCKRTCDYLSLNDTAILYNEDQSEKAKIHMAVIQDIYTMSVTMDNIGEFAAKAEKIGFLNLKCNTISVAVDDLMVYQNYFDSPLQFLHFLKQRKMATRNETLALNDELDHLGIYIHHNCYALSDDSPKQPTMKSFLGYREDLDTYFGQLYHPKLKPQKPIQTLPKYFEQMLEWLNSSNLNNKIRVANYLLDFSSDAKEGLNNQIEYTLQRQLVTHHSSAISASGRSDTDLRYTCFVCLEGAEDFSDQEKLDYTLSTLLWNKESNRVQISLKYSKDRKIQDIAYAYLTLSDIPPERKTTLYQEGKERAEQRIQQFQMVNHRKIGRNELCPCGSGKKYKKCCGR